VKRRLLIVLFALLFAACAPARTDLPPDPQRLVAGGQTLYWENCSECHQSDGQGWSHLYPRLAGNPIVILHDPSPLISTVLYGQGSMPPFHDTLTANEIAAILSYIRNAWGNHADAVSPRQIH
jgi:mono/diheme cytochrome c family protein